jgi:catechol 2,3-dioxygenase-like lactoylglutathione lyase family enzyme
MNERKRPSVSMGHVVLHTDDMASSIAFYETLGLVTTPSPTVSADELMLMEMRGGTDLLIVHKESSLIPEFPVSNVGYSGHRGPIDIMIPQHEREDLERYRSRLQTAGLDPGAISEKPQFGHWYFRLTDPNGHTITVLTSHSSFE